MLNYFPASPADATAVAALLPVSLGKLTAQQLAQLLLEPSPQLLVDCGGLVAPHPLGVCHFATQLVLLRQKGVCVYLCNVHPVLRHCLHQLKLQYLFHSLGERTDQALPRAA
ncbi:hypothetical protein [Hymenobacter sp. YC55]|uniref:hypothetical protein n=1 Tax=Hymenobacter sp. YC55 TaxID=3034019 RepID=UPI0023F84756|nr:hypothetical protein [Hymenobacter sp. YC55]MDF7815250.1 hypothetical protein [Hymenobacter sp. YC55]